MSRNFTVDDAFISWRHGFNLVKFGNYSFNPYGEKIEAATSPLFGLISGIPVLLDINTVFFFKMLTIALIMFFFAFTFRFFLELKQFILIALAFAGPAQAIHLWSGLETSYFVILLAYLMAASLGIFNLSLRVYLMLTLILILMRLESSLIVPFLSYLFVGQKNLEHGIPALSSKEKIVKAFLLSLPSLSLIGFMTLFRLTYFGELFPNTFATKSESSLVNFSEAVAFFELNSPTFLKFLILSVLLIISAEKKFRTNLVLLLIPVCFIAFFVYSPSNLQMNYLNRFSYQIFWPIVLVSVMATNFKFNLKLVYKGVVVTLLWVAPLNAGLNFKSWNLDEYNWWLSYYPRMTSSYGELGRAIATLNTKDAQPPKLVIGDIGLVSYLNNAFVLDTAFKATKPTVGIPGIVSQLDSPGSGIVAFFTSSESQIDVGGYQDPIRKLAESNGYVRVGSICWYPSNWLQIWISNDLATNKPFMEQINAAILESKSQNDRFRTIESDIQPWYWRY